MWSSNLIHNQTTGATNSASYSLDFFTDSVSRKVINMNMVLYYDNQEHILENVINGENNDIFSTLLAVDVEYNDALDILSSVMNKLWNQNFVAPKPVIE